MQPQAACKLGMKPGFTILGKVAAITYNVLIETANLWHCEVCKVNKYEIIPTDVFSQWYAELSRPDQRAVAARVEVLAEQGMDLGFPYTSKIYSSRHGRMRELRVQSRGKPIRVLYAFDPNRAVVLLVGGHKSNNRFYDQLIPIADDLYSEHAQGSRKENRPDEEPTHMGGLDATLHP